MIVATHTLTLTRTVSEHAPSNLAPPADPSPGAAPRSGRKPRLGLLRHVDAAHETPVLQSGWRNDPQASRRSRGFISNLPGHPTSPTSWAGLGPAPAGRGERGRLGQVALIVRGADHILDPGCQRRRG